MHNKHDNAVIGFMAGIVVLAISISTLYGCITALVYPSSITEHSVLNLALMGMSQAQMAQLFIVLSLIMTFYSMYMMRYFGNPARYNKEANQQHPDF